MSDVTLPVNYFGRMCGYVIRTKLNMDKFRSLFGAAILALASLPANAALITDQNQPNNNTIMAYFRQADLAQSFQQANNNVAGAGILLTGPGNSHSPVTIELWDALPNSGGEILATGRGLGTAGHWLDIFWPPVAIVPDTTSYLVFAGLNPNFGIHGATNNPYDRGQVYANAGFGSFPGFDYTFRTYSETGVSAVPVPAAIWLFGTGLLGLIGFSRRNKVA